ncbi:MAG: ABC transporter ATP-binding protein [Oscillospiraceae bacterium]|nr:ABC transporter ATP-binding protein [Oscillospiraceae bacterium]
MIEVKHLTKRYGDHTAVSDLSFTMERGRIYGFLGPNGAGKSTTMNILTGCLSATSGEVTIDGHDIFEDARAAKKLIGYLPEIPPLYPDRTPREYLNFVAECKDVPGNQRAEQIRRVMEQTAVTEVADRLIRNLSKGYRQRLGIAQALLGDPEIVILDEPTVGLDPRQIMEIRELIKGLGRDHTVILSSHILSEVQAVCERVLIISGGKLVACEETADLERHFAGKAALELTVEAGKADVGPVLDALEGVESFSVEENGNYVNLKLETDREPDDMCRDLFWAFSDAGKPILRLTTTRASLEEIFLELTREEKEENAQ